MRILGIDVPGKYLGGYAVIDEAGRVLDIGDIDFRRCISEQAEYSKLYRILNRVKHRFHIDVAAIERPFLYLIAQWVGAIKMWLCSDRRSDIVGWFMVGSSQARKSVLGSGTLSKDDVLRRMRRHAHRPLTQHQADALLYALSYLKNPVLEGKIEGRHRNKKYKLWRQRVIQRDGRICRKCNRQGLRGRQLQVHHRKSVKEFPELQYAISNGEVWCIQCHVSSEQKGRKKPEGFGAKVSQKLKGKPKSKSHRAALRAAWKRRRLVA